MTLRSSVVAALALAAFALPAGSAHANTVTPGCTLADLSPVQCDVWHSGAVTLRWTWDPDLETGTTGCATQTFTQDTPASGDSVTCTVHWGVDFAGATAIVRLDGTPPLVTSATPARPPDHNGWYNHPVAFTFHGSDATSGVAACDTVSYAGPDGPHAAVLGGCTDFAGNHGVAPFPLAYDNTSPAPARVREAPGNRAIRLTWVAPPDAARVRVMRFRNSSAKKPKTIYQGSGTRVTDRGLRNGVRYHYTVTVFDQAGNGTTRHVGARPTASPLRPVSGTVVRTPPRLHWRRVRGADYYNVQLLLRGRKILSAWPARPR
jgi:hypothetical protein